MTSQEIGLTGNFFFKLIRISLLMLPVHRLVLHGTVRRNEQCIRLQQCTLPSICHLHVMVATANQLDI